LDLVVRWFSRDRRALISPIPGAGCRGPGLFVPDPAGGHAEMGGGRARLGAAFGAIQLEIAALATVKPTDLFIVQKTQQAMRALEDARMRGAREHTLLALALVVSRVQVNHLVKPVPSVQAAMVRLRSETARHAAKLAAEQVIQYESNREARRARTFFRKRCRLAAWSFRERPPCCGVRSMRQAPDRHVWA